MLIVLEGSKTIEAISVLFLGKITLFYSVETILISLHVMCLMINGISKVDFAISGCFCINPANPGSNLIVYGMIVSVPSTI